MCIRDSHLEAVVAFAFDALEVMKKYRAWNGEAIGLRIGINTCLLYTSRCV